MYSKFWFWNSEIKIQIPHKKIKEKWENKSYMRKPSHISRTVYPVGPIADLSIRFRSLMLAACLWTL